MVQPGNRCRIPLSTMLDHQACAWIWPARCVSRAYGAGTRTEFLRRARCAPACGGSHYSRLRLV